MAKSLFFMFISFRRFAPFQRLNCNTPLNDHSTIIASSISKRERVSSHWKFPSLRDINKSIQILFVCQQRKERRKKKQRKILTKHTFNCVKFVYFLNGQTRNSHSISVFQIKRTLNVYWCAHMNRTRRVWICSVCNRMKSMQILGPMRKQLVRGRVSLNRNMMNIVRASNCIDKSFHLAWNCWWFLFEQKLNFVTVCLTDV